MLATEVYNFLMKLIQKIGVKRRKLQSSLFCLLCPYLIVEKYGMQLIQVDELFLSGNLPVQALVSGLPAFLGCRNFAFFFP